MTEESKRSDLYRTQTRGEFPSDISISLDSERRLTLERELKYGTNPRHAAAVYNPNGNTPLFQEVKTGKGGPSQTNFEDVDRALRIIRVMNSTWSSMTTTAVMKHVNPSGVAINSFARAWDCDARAAYGSTVALSHTVDYEFLKTAYKHIRSHDKRTFIDVMVAPEFTPEALEYLQKKEAIRVFKYDAERLSKINPFQKGELELKPLMDGRVIAYEPYTEFVHSSENFEIVTKAKPGLEDCANLLFAWNVGAHTRSNSVVFAHDLATLAIGTGKQERIRAIEDAVHLAEQKAAYRKEKPEDCLRGSVMASDGFIPNVDNVEELRKKGIRAIIQPGGSKAADDAVIAACDKYGIAMAFTGARCFSHH